MAAVAAAWATACWLARFHQAHGMHATLPCPHHCSQELGDALAYQPLFNDMKLLDLKHARQVGLKTSVMHSGVECGTSSTRQYVNRFPG